MYNQTILTKYLPSNCNTYVSICMLVVEFYRVEDLGYPQLFDNELELQFHVSHVVILKKNHTCQQKILN